jgi:ABC-2 type transport system permease protein
MLLGWFVGITFVTALTLSVYNSFSNGAIGDSLQNLPPAIQKLAGNADSFKSVGGYISQQIFALRMPVLLMILSIAVLVGLTGGEEQQGLLETQLSMPVSRSQLLLQKLAAGASVVSIASLGAVAGVGAGLVLIGHTYNMLNMLPHLLNCLLVAFTYGLVGFAIASATGRRGVALGVSSGVAFLSYLVNSMASSVSIMHDLDKFTLFHYYNTDGGYNGADLLLVVCIALTLVIISLVTFERRDIS